MWRQYSSLPRAVHVLCVGTLINRAGTLIIPFLTLYITKQLGYGESFAAFCMGAYGVGAIGAVLVGGHLADSLGRRTVMVLALFGGASAIVIFAFLTTKTGVVLGILAFSFLMEMFRPAASAMMADLVTPDQRAHAYSLQYIAVNLGFSIAAFAGGAIVTGLSYRWLFWLDAATAAAFGVIVMFGMRETLPAKSPSGASDALADKHDDYSALEAFRHIFTDGTYMLFILATFLLATVYMQAMTTFPLYLQDFGINEAKYGRIIALNGLLIVVLQVPMTALVHRFHRGAVLWIAALITGAGFGMMGLAGTPWQFAGAVCVWTLGEIAAAPLTPSVVSDLAPERLRGRYMGVLSMSFACGGVFGVPLGGQVLRRFGGDTLWTLTVIFAIAAAILYFLIRKHLAARQDPPQTAK